MTLIPATNLDDPLEDLGDLERSLSEKHSDSSERAVSSDVSSLDPTENSMPTTETQDLIERSSPAPDVLYYAPITRVDCEKREVIGTATAEVKDAYRTVIGYEASKDALTRWPRNIREMHQNIAVGSALDVIPDDEHKRIVVRARISRGAQDTWEKVLDGTLKGFSIGGKNGKWTKRIIDGEELPYLERYDMAELSLVDNPGCPGCTIEVVRADGVTILATDEEMSARPDESCRGVAVTDDAAAIQAALSAAFIREQAQGDAIERAGAKHSKSTTNAMHDMRNHQLLGAMKTMKACGCEECVTARKVLDPDEDGDIDLAGLYDPDKDGGLASRALFAQLTRDLRSHIEASVQAALGPVVQRIDALALSTAGRSDEPEITRRVDGLHEQLSAIKTLVEKIANQPMDGGPVLHGAPGIPVDKRLASQSSAQRSASDADVLRRALELGFTPPATQDAQIFAASALMPRPR